jgi:digeranylgeranylglycerophospholipid reductase
MQSYDIVIVGAGPGGSMAALTAAKLGLETLLVERDPVVGTPVRCAEGVDHKGLSGFFDPDPSWISATIERYYLVSPDGDAVEMNIFGNTGYILDRTIFDRMIAEKAAEASAEVMTGVEAVAMSEFSEGHRRVTLSDGGRVWDVGAFVVVAADGVESRVARWAGIDTACPLGDMETCAQVVLADIDIDHTAFQLHFTRDYAPGGYAWVFPKGPGIANVGLGISGTNAKQKTPYEYLEAFTARYFPGGRVVSRTVGGVQCTGGIGKLTADGLMVCGDAGHMANPITGGGIINAMIAGRAAGETAAQALKKGHAVEKSLMPYDKICNERFAKMNRLFYRVKEGILSIPNERFNELAREMLAIPLEKRTPVRVLTSALLRNPKLLALLPRLVF